ncbi:MAG: YhcG family protein [Coriobacteriales bacterium]
MLANTDEYKESLSRVVGIISSARANAVQRASAEMVRMYWETGAVLNENAAYGTAFIESLSRDIRAAFPGIKGFSARSLRYMAKFAREVDAQFCSGYCRIPWGHIMKLLDKTQPGEEREWYLNAAIENGWSQSVLDHQIDLRLYERQALAGKVTNFDRTLPAPDSELAQQALKDPYVFDFITARQSMVERDIEDELVSNVTSLLLELGTGFAFMGRQYHLSVGQEDFYIDLLFYNARLHRYVVVELKNEKFKPEFTGKLSFYVAAVDGELRGPADGPTVGLLLCKSKDDVVARYALQDINQPIGVSEYRLGDALPGELGECLPSPEDLESRL